MNLLKDHAPKLWDRFQALKEVTWPQKHQKRWGDLRRMVRNKHHHHHISFGHIRKELDFFEYLEPQDEN